MNKITSHVLDTTLGRPASGVPVILEQETAEHGWRRRGSGLTNKDGRVHNLVSEGAALPVGRYRLSFDTASYFALQNTRGFFPQVCIVFQIDEPEQDYHIPLLLSRFGYTTYRGS